MKLFEKIPVDFLKAIALFFAGLTIMDVLDFAMKVVTFTITTLVSLLIYRHYKLKIQLTKKEIELKDQELYKVIKDNTNHKTK